jgi:tetratricopeptide (TPR) repeat protein
MNTLTLSATNIESHDCWQWVLAESPGAPAITVSDVNLNPRDPDYAAFSDIRGFLRWHTDPDKRIENEAALTLRVGEWISRNVFGQRLAAELAARAPVTVQLDLPMSLEYLIQRPLELATYSGKELARLGVTLIFNLTNQIDSGSPKEAISDSLRMLAIFSMPTDANALGLRRERRELEQLVSRLAARSGSSIELEILQYGATREKIAKHAADDKGWDILHISAHGGAGSLLLETASGNPDLLPANDLINLLRPIQSRLKLTVLSACESGGANALDTFRWLRLDNEAEHLESGSGAAGLDDQADARPSAMMQGVAQELATALDCVAVAMRYPLSDEFAMKFTGALYAELLEDGESLDRAFSTALNEAIGQRPSPAAPPLCIATPTLLGAKAAGLRLNPPSETGYSQRSSQPVMPTFPAEPKRFVGRTAPMTRASAVLAPQSDQCAVLVHGMAGAGKTACALELAYCHKESFKGHAFWQAPSDPDEISDSMASLALSLDRQLGHLGLEIVGRADNVADLRRYLPDIVKFLNQSRVLLVLDNLETLLDTDGEWRDARLRLFIRALSSHGGQARALLTSRICPTDLDERVLLIPIHALSLTESVLLARELPNLGRLLRTYSDAGQSDGRDELARNLVRRLLHTVQGHPKLLEFADAAAVDPNALAARLDHAGKATDGGRLEAFFKEGTSALDPQQFLLILQAWTISAAKTLPPDARLMLELLCCLEQLDRYFDVVEAAWPELWQHVNSPSELPAIDVALQPSIKGSLVQVMTDGTGEGAFSEYHIHPAVAETIRAAASTETRETIDRVLALAWTSIHFSAQEANELEDGRLIVYAGLAAVPYLIRLREWNEARLVVDLALKRDLSPPARSLGISYLRHIWRESGDHLAAWVLGAELIEKAPDEANELLQHSLEAALENKDYEAAAGISKALADLELKRRSLPRALEYIDQTAKYTQRAGFGPWTQCSDKSLRLQIRSELGEDENVFQEAMRLMAIIGDLPLKPASNERVEPWGVREAVLNVAVRTALKLRFYDEALELNAQMVASMLDRSAGDVNVARVYLHDYDAFQALGRFADAQRVLRVCQQVFDNFNDADGLARVFQAKGRLAFKAGNIGAAASLHQKALRYAYAVGDQGLAADCHMAIANVLILSGEDPSGQLLHRLAGIMLDRAVTGRGDVAAVDPLVTSLLVAGGHRVPTDFNELSTGLERAADIPFARLFLRISDDPSNGDELLRDIVESARSARPDVFSAMDDYEPVIAVVAGAARRDKYAVDCLDVVLENLENDGPRDGDKAPRRFLAAALRGISNGEYSEMPIGNDNGLDYAIVRRARDAVDGLVIIRADASDGLQQAVERWDPLIAGITAAAQGDGEARYLVEGILSSRERDPEWVALVPALRRIMDGQYAPGDDPRKLRPFGAGIVNRTLSVLAGAVTLDATAENLLPAPEVREEWDRVIEGVAAAVNGNRQAAAAIEDYLDGLERHVGWGGPIAVKIRRVMAGNRGDDLLQNAGHFDRYVIRRIITAIEEGVNFVGELDDLGLTSEDRDRWDPMICGMVEAAKGDRLAIGVMDTFFSMLEIGGNRRLAAALRGAISGNPDQGDPRGLGLDPLGQAIVRRTMAAMAGSLTIPATVEVFLEFWLVQKIRGYERAIAVVIGACQGNPQALANADGLLSVMRDDPNRKAVAEVFRQIIRGRRDSALMDGLGSLDAAVVSRALGALAGTITPFATLEDFVNASAAAPEELEPVIAAIIEAADGDRDAMIAVEPFLRMLDEKSLWSAALGSALRRLIAGERGSGLLVGLDIFGSSVVRRALGAISGDITLTSPAQEYVDKTLNAILEPNAPFIEAVIAAAQGNAKAMDAIASSLDELAAEQQSSGFAAALRRIVDGERGADLLDGLEDSTFFVVARRVLAGLTSETDGQ